MACTTSTQYVRLDSSPKAPSKEAIFSPSSSRRSLASAAENPIEQIASHYALVAFAHIIHQTREEGKVQLRNLKKIFHIISDARQKESCHSIGEFDNPYAKIASKKVKPYIEQTFIFRIEDNRLLTRYQQVGVMSFYKPLAVATPNILAPTHSLYKSGIISKKELLSKQKKLLSKISEQFNQEIQKLNRLLKSKFPSGVSLKTAVTPRGSARSFRQHWLTPDGDDFYDKELSSAKKAAYSSFKMKNSTPPAIEYTFKLSIKTKYKIKELTESSCAQHLTKWRARLESISELTQRSASGESKTAR